MQFFVTGKSFMRSIRIRIVGLVIAIFMVCYTVQAQDSLKAVSLFFGSIVQPLLSPDGQYLYVARKDYQGNLGQANAADIWFSRRLGNSWMPMIHLPYPVNDFADNYPAGIGLNREWIASVKRQEDSIYVQGYRRQGRHWGIDWSALPIVSDSMRYWFDWHLGHNQQTLLFCASSGPDQPADIFLARRLEKDRWSFPERLPSPVNSAYHEATAFLAADGKGLYLSSDRPGGQGGQDLLYSEAHNTSYTSWTNPQNLGSSVNSTGHDTDATIPVTGESCIFVRTRGDTSQIYQHVLPLFARPQSVSLISIKLTSSAALDSFALIIFPLDRPPLQNIIPKTSRSEEQLVLPTGQAYGIYAQTDAPLFSASQIINLSDTPAEPLDYSVYSDTSVLQESRTYQERTGIIRNLQQQLQQTEQEIAQQISRQETSIKRLYQLEFSPLPPGVLNRNDPEMRAIENQYEEARRQQAKQDTPRFSQSEYDLFVSSPILDTLHAETAQERLNRLRQRFRLRQEDGYVSDNPLNAATLDSLEQQAQQPPEFSIFRRDLVRRLQARLFTEVREDVVQRAIPAALQRVHNQLGDNERFILNRDEHDLPQLLSNLEIPIQPPDTTILRPLDTWQRPFADRLNNRLRATLRPLMRSALNDDVRRYFVRVLTHYIKKERQNILEESLYRQIDEQIADEERLGNWNEKLTVPLNPPNMDPVPPEVRISLPLEQARRHRPVELEALLFRPNQATFLAAAIPDLKRIIDFLRQYPTRRVHLVIHTHPGLTHTFASKLTRQRARQIRQYLEQAGIAPERIRTEAMGCSRPKTGNMTPAGLARNQRVEVYFFTEGSKE